MWLSNVSFVSVFGSDQIGKSSCKQYLVDGHKERRLTTIDRLISYEPNGTNPSMFGSISHIDRCDIYECNWRYSFSFFLLFYILSFCVFLFVRRTDAIYVYHFRKHTRLILVYILSLSVYNLEFERTWLFLVSIFLHRNVPYDNGMDMTTTVLWRQIEIYDFGMGYSSIFYHVVGSFSFLVILLTGQWVLGSQWNSHKIFPSHTIAMTHATSYCMN